MTRATSGFVVAGLLTAATAGVLSMTAGAQNPSPPTAGADKSLEGLLKEGDIGYIRNQEGLFRIPLEDGGEATLIAAREVPIYKNRETGQEVKVVLLWSMVAALPEGFKPPVAMLQRLAQLNDGMVIGNVGLGGDRINYSSSFWLRTADKEVLIAQLQLTHKMRLELRKELLPYIQE